MSDFGKSPGGHRRPGTKRWKYLPVPNGAQAVGWIAGPTVGVWSHHRGGTKPCRHTMSDSALSCGLCADGEPPVWRGYVPLYDRDYCRRFVLISEDYEEAVRELTLHAPVKLQRGKGSREPVTIRFEQWRVQPLALGEGRNAAADITPFLLRMWKDAELEQWYYSRDIPLAQGSASSHANRLDGVGLAPPDPAAKRDNRSGADILAAALAGSGLGGDDAPAPPPSKNGRHKKV